MMHGFSGPAPIVALLLLLGSSPLSTAEDLVAGRGSAASAAAASDSPRNDEVWLVSTRHLCFPSWEEPRSFELDVRRYDRGDGWSQSSVAEFATQPPLATVFYVHGNRVGWEAASQYGWQVYWALARCSQAPARIRFVIWTWTSDQIRGPLRDIRSKADRADDAGLFLGWFLSQLHPETPLGLLGYSYGSRVVTGGLHLLAGGSLQGIALPQPADPRRKPGRAVLLAAAMDHDWLCPDHRHGRAVSAVEQLLVVYNTCDPALRHYGLVDKCSRPQALGLAGVSDECLGGYASRVEQIDVSAIVGRTHNEDNYFRVTVLDREVCRVLFPTVPAPKDGD